MNITKRYGFESAHVLPWHTGKCGRLHGHSYILDVTVTGPVKGDSGAPDSGMVIDFADISLHVKPLIEQLDHHDLNQYINNPTAEHLVEYIVAKLSPVLPGLSAVRLYETATGWVEWSRL